MTTGEIKQALVGRVLCYEGLELLTINDCEAIRRNMMIARDGDHKAFRMSRKCAEALAKNGIYELDDIISGEKRVLIAFAQAEKIEEE